MGIFPTRFLNKVLFALGTLAVLLLITAAAYFYWQYQQLASQNPAKEIEHITNRLSKFMELPSGAMPTLATVTEKEKLIDQDFFKQAENGDKVLIYLAEGKAILYRPSTGKVIDVAPVRRTDALATQDGLASPEESPAKTGQRVPISVYNGTTQAGSATALFKKLEEVSFSYTESIIRTANRQNYTKTIVIDLDGTHPEQAREVATLIDGSMDTLPEDETPPEGGGLLIIVGLPQAEPTPVATASPPPGDETAE